MMMDGLRVNPLLRWVISAYDFAVETDCLQLMMTMTTTMTVS